MALEMAGFRATSLNRGAKEQICPRYGIRDRVGPVAYFHARLPGKTRRLANTRY